MTVFPDGRAIVKGTTDIGLARSLYARYVGA
jgi:adenylyltransferase/sulfurtransferase